MGWSFRSSLKFNPLRMPPSGINASANVRGARVPVHARATYVTFGPHGFGYHAKRDNSAGSSIGELAQIAPNSAFEDARSRLNRRNLFKPYAVTAAVLLLWMVSSTFLLFWLATLSLIGVAIYRWDRERRTARIVYDVDNEWIVNRLALCQAAAESLARAQSLWRIQNSTDTTQSKYHAGATALIQRDVARCVQRPLKGLELNIEPWLLILGTQELLLLPDCLLIRDGNQLAPVPYQWLSTAHATKPFIEEAHPPSDAKVLGTTWRFVNKSGGPDLRFNGNRQLPILEYGELVLQSRAGLNTLLQASAPAATWYAAQALQELARLASPPTAATAQSPASLPHVSAPPVPAPAPPPPKTPAVSGDAPQHARPPAPKPKSFVPSPPQTSTRAFLGISQVLTVAGRNIARPLTFVAPNTRGIDSSTIVTALPVGDARHAGPLPYWPSYAECDQYQRGKYLDWMAGGRVDPNIDIGYVFIFFYGLEWRALHEGLDVDLACEEVQRLLSIYGTRSGSFRSYATEFLVFSLPAMSNGGDERDVDRLLGQVLDRSAAAAAVLLAWYIRRGLPLPARHALKLAPMLDGAKRSVVAKRAERELGQLFTSRYQQAHGTGLALVAGKRELSLEYRAASSSWQRIGARLTVKLPDVLTKWGQFKPIVNIWNDCIEDLKKTARLKEKSGGALSAEAWAALPPELRAQYDHPDRDRWDAIVAAAPRLEAFHLLKAGDLASLTGLPRADKVSAVQLRKITETAAELGYSLEPDGRAQRRALKSTDEVAIWSSEDTTCPDPKLYGAAFVLLSLAMQIAMADGVLADEEAYVVLTMLTKTFSLDETLRKRFVALQHLLARQPVRAAALAKKLQTTRSPAELAKVGRILVSVATVDGIVTDEEHDTLRTLYKALGLPARDLTAALANSGAKLASDQAVEVQAGTAGSPAEPLPQPPRPTHAVDLDQAAIAAIIADTRDVAAMLAEVFEQEEAEEQEEKPAPVAAQPQPTTASASPVAVLAPNLDVRYHAVLAELLTKSSWTKDEVRTLAMGSKMMPGAILETLNTWSEETFGDFLIDEGDGWQIHSDLLQRQSA